MTLKTQAAIVALFGLTVNAAAAQENANRNLYVTVFAGASLLDDDTVELRQTGTDSRVDVDYDTGFLTGAAIGYRLTENLRLEGELVYRTNELESELGDGDFSALMLGVNGYYDFTQFSPRLTPYLGLGLVWAQEIDIDFERPGGEQSYSSDEFGIQAMLGARYQISSPWALNVELRYLSLGDLELEHEGGSGEVTASYDPLSVVLGISYQW